MLSSDNQNLCIDIEEYAYQHTKAEPKLLQNLIQETKLSTAGANMLTGRIEGRFLKLLVNISNAKNILEIGTFTGYSALNMAEALPNHGQLVTCEVCKKSASIAAKYFNNSPHGHKIKISMGPALATIKKTDTSNKSWDFVFIDADKQNYLNYYDAVIPKVKIGGLIVIDNALWGGEVINPQTKHAKIIDQLNKKIQLDPRVENVLLTVRDGVNIVQKTKHE